MITQKKGSFPLHIENNGDEYVVITSLGNHYASTFDPAAARLISVAPEMLAALQNIYANAAESPEWIRMTIAALEKATPSACNCDAECNGPVPPYCPEHDGDYSDFLVANNCD